MAWRSDISACGVSASAEGWPLAIAGGRRTSSAVGIIRTATNPAMICMDVRQSWLEISQAASGDMVMGAMPMPAETSDTARLRWVSNQPVTQAIIGAKIAAQAPPTTTPKKS